MSVLGLRAEGFVCFVVCVCVCVLGGLIDLHRILRACGLLKIFGGDASAGRTPWVVAGRRILVVGDGPHHEGPPR